MKKTNNYFTTKYRHLVYHVTLCYGYLRNKLTPQKWPAYSKITENLYLGRLPLKNLHEHTALHKEGIEAVLSAVENFENNTNGLFTKPVRPGDWQKLGITQFQVESPDFAPLSVASLQKGVHFIDQQIKLGKKVYVHCKAGRGRSAALVVAYLVKSGQYASIQDAINHVQTLRPIITLHNDKIASIQAYIKRVEVSAMVGLKAERHDALPSN